MIKEIQKIASTFAEEYCSDAIYPSHIFKALLSDQIGAVRFIEVDLKKDYYYLQEWADIQMQLSPRSARPVWDMSFSAESLAVIDEAESYSEKFGLEEVNAAALLASLVTPGVGFSFDQLKTLPITAAEVCAKFSVDPSQQVVSQGVTAAARSGGEVAAGGVEKYCVNLLEKAKSGEVAPVIGFEAEIAVIYEILGRKYKSNLLITGESGVGKTSLIMGFVHQLVAGSVPSFLKDSVIYELDLAALGADSQYKGEVEDRFKKLLAEVKQIPGAILVIESIDKLFDKQGSLYGASGILNAELGKGNILLLCTSSIDGYTKSIETDKEFASKLEKITVEEPNADLCLKILKGAIASYEQYHGLTIDESVMGDTIRLAKRYLTEKSLPDSAFDLIDRTMALVKTMNDISKRDVAKFKEELMTLKESRGEYTTEQFEQRVDWMQYEMVSKLSCILLAQLESDVDFSKLPSAGEKIALIESMTTQIEPLCETPRLGIESSDISAVVAKQTGIPLGKVQSKERDRLTNGEATLKKRVVGQDHAVKILLDAVFESRSGLNKKGQPMGSFFFLGPTGTGKTELSKALAAFLFEDESSLIRFDMSEFKEEHSVALLYGAPPGYVGYEEGGLLVNKIRQKPYSVVLFDEIEKAHKSVFDLFLQILDEGKLHDRLGRVGDFSNALILFTSNIGSKFVVDQFNSGVIPQNNDLMEIMQDHFRPEFLGRLTEIIPFSPITEQTVVAIFNIHLRSLEKLLDEQNIELVIGDEAKRFIAMQGYNQQYGARPIIGIIRKELRRPLSKLIISGEIKSGDKVEVTVVDGVTTFNTIK